MILQHLTQRVYQEILGCSIILMGPQQKKEKKEPSPKTFQDIKKKLAEANKNNKTMTKELVEEKNGKTRKK